MQSKLFSNYEYKNINILDAPYYGIKKINSWYRNSDSTSLENRLSYDLKENKVTIMDQHKVLKALNFKKQNKQFDILNFQNFGSHFPEKSQNLEGENGEFGYNKQMFKNNINLRIDNKHDSSFIFNYQYLTHKTYKVIISTVEDKWGDNINNINPSEGKETRYGAGLADQWASIWYVIQKLKNIFEYLKNLSYYGEHSDIIKNQYDNTNIYVVSDHGNYLEDKKELEVVNDILVRNNLMSFEQKKFLEKEFTNSKFSPISFSTMFMTKPRKYIHQNWNKQINNNLENLFSLDTTLTMADFLPFVEVDLQKNKQDLALSYLKNIDFVFNEKESFFYQKNVENLVINPLMNKELLNQRIIPLVHIDWEFKPKKFKYILRSINYFKSKKGIFDLERYN